MKIWETMDCIPDDFPADTPTALSGFQPKVALSKAGRQYFAGSGPATRHIQWLICEEMVKSLAASCKDLPPASWRDKLIEFGDADQSNLSRRERLWVCSRAAALLDLWWPSPPQWYPVPVQIDDAIAEAFTRRMDTVPKTQSSLKTFIQNKLYKK